MKTVFSLLPKRSFLIAGFGFLYMEAQAQVIYVSLKVVNQKKEPVSFATFIVISHADSSQTEKKAADSSGIAIFKLSKGVAYTVRITSVNYQPINKGLVITGNQTFFRFVAEPLPKILRNAVVISQKPLMRQEDDKTIVDPENLAAASTNAYEIIEKTPGIFLDQDGNVYLTSMTPAAIYINGREMKMSTADIATMLKNLPPHAVSKIEILRTPSARYDASTTGGIVNIVLRKGVKLGLTGSGTVGLNQGTYGSRFAGFTLNNNTDKQHSYLNFNYGRRNNYERIKTDRYFAFDSLLSQNAYTIYPANSYFLGYGVGYDLTKKWEIDLTGNITLNDFNNNTENQSVIKKLSASQILVNNLNKVNNKGNSLVMGNGIESKLRIDTTGSEWTSDLFYSHANNKSDQFFTTTHYFPVIPFFGGDGRGENKRNFFFVTSDLKLKMKKKFTLETGAKTSVHNFHNFTNYFRESGGIRTKDNGRTNTFRYNENINAFYLQGSKTFGKDIVLKTGTRLENTNMKGRQIIPDDTTFTIHRTDLFPYVYLSKHIMKILGYDLRAFLVYRRSISRPVYEQLNPFPRYVDQYLSEVGNPGLRPQFTTNYEVNVSVDERPVLAIGINQTKDIFTNVVYQSDTSQSQAYRTYDNIGKNKEWYLKGLGALPPGGKYFFVLGGQYNHNFYQGLYENKPLSFKKGTWTFFTYQSLKLGKRSQVTLNGFVRFKGQQQFYELSSFGALNSSINRQFFKQKLIITLSVNDIFATNKNDFTINQGSVNATGTRSSDTRRIGINLRYNFGIRKKEENNIFNVESPEKTN